MNHERSAESLLTEPIIEILTSFYTLVPLSDLSLLLKAVGYHFATEELVRGACSQSVKISYAEDVGSGDISDEFVSLSELPTFYRLFDRVLSGHQEILLLRGFCDYYAIVVEIGGEPDIVAEIYGRIEDLSINLPADLVAERATCSGDPVDWREVYRDVAEGVYGSVERRERERMIKRFGLGGR